MSWYPDTLTSMNMSAIGKFQTLFGISRRFTAGKYPPYPAFKTLFFCVAKQSWTFFRSSSVKLPSQLLWPDQKRLFHRKPSTRIRILKIALEFYELRFIPSIHKTRSMFKRWFSFPSWLNDLWRTSKLVPIRLVIIRRQLSGDWSWKSKLFLLADYSTTCQVLKMVFDTL